MIPQSKLFFETGTATFFEDVEFGGINKVRDILFEEEEYFLTTFITLDYV